MLLTLVHPIKRVIIQTLKREFNRYIRRHQSGVPRSIKGFLPDRLWTAAEMAELMARFGIQRVPDIFAIVTATGRMCSVLMGKVPDNRSSTGQWVSLGVKQCTNIMNYNDITAFCAVAPSRAPSELLLLLESPSEFNPTSFT